ncbi:Histone_H2A [Hexamita inflata]|uniref:Histone H2A n=1 Tax=Hexamita inflata TaxID=28002 RepID=A0ABP1IJW9_9EUKA
MAFDKKSKSRSARAGVIFPVGRIHRHLKEGRYADRISSDAPVYMAAVLQQVVEEVFKEAETRKDNKATKRLVPNNILTAIRKDKELNDIFKDIVIREGGVPRSEKKEKSEKGKKSQERYCILYLLLLSTLYIKRFLSQLNDSVVAAQSVDIARLGAKNKSLAKQRHTATCYYFYHILIIFVS